MDTVTIATQPNARCHTMKETHRLELKPCYQGGRGDVRSMEGMCQQITQDCANAVQTSVWTRATLNIAPEQQMIVECSANVSSVRRAAGAGRGAEKARRTKNGKAPNDSSSPTGASVGNRSTKKGEDNAKL